VEKQGWVLAELDDALSHARARPPKMNAEGAATAE
jgi:hypothetical protein